MAAIGLGVLASASYAAEPPPLTGDIGARVAWKLLGEEPNYDALAAKQIRGNADDAARLAKIETAAAAYRAALEGTDASPKTYGVGFTSQVTEYDPVAGGVYLRTFEPGNGLRLYQGNSQEAAKMPFPVDTDVGLQFTNACDLVFVKCDPATAAKMNPNGTNLRIDVVPISARRTRDSVQDKPSEQSPPQLNDKVLLYAHVARLRGFAGLPGSPGAVLFDVKAPTGPEKPATPVSTGTRPTPLSIDSSIVGISWHKLAGKVPIDFQRGTYNLLEIKGVFAADEFERPAVIKFGTARVKSEYDATDPKATYFISTGAVLGEYSFEKEGFDLKLGGATFAFSSWWPFPKTDGPGDPNRYRYEVRLTNADQISLIKLPPAKAKALVKAMANNRSVDVNLEVVIAKAEPVADELAGSSEPRVLECTITRAQIVRPNGVPLANLALAASGEVAEAPAAQPATEAPQAESPAPSPKSGTPPPPAVVEAPKAEAPAPPAVAPPAAVAGGAIDPASVDVKGLKVGMKADAFIAAGKAVFPTLRHEPVKLPSAMQFSNPQTNEELMAYVDAADTIYAIRYFRKLDAEQAAGAADSLIEKYGPPLLDSGPLPGKKGGTMRSLKWTAGNPAKDGLINGEVMESAGQAILAITLQLPGTHTPKPKPGAAPGGGVKPKKKLDL